MLNGLISRRCFRIHNIFCISSPFKPPSWNPRVFLSKNTSAKNIFQIMNDRWSSFNWSRFDLMPRFGTPKILCTAAKTQNTEQFDWNSLQLKLTTLQFSLSQLAGKFQAWRVHRRKWGFGQPRLVTTRKILLRFLDYYTATNNCTLTQKATPGASQKRFQRN